MAMLISKLVGLLAYGFSVRRVGNLGFEDRVGSDDFEVRFIGSTVVSQALSGLPGLLAAADAR
jgi:hypothetical protein